MAGAAAAGAGAARRDLFAGRPWLLVPTARSDDASIGVLSALVREAGAVPKVVDAAVHDAAMTWVSHLPLAVASALATAVERGAGERARGLAGPGLLDTTRLAETPRALAMELALADPGRLAAALDEVAGGLGSLSRALRAGDSDAVRRFFEEASAARGAIRF
jgi:prephenate dehydrogenase